MTVTTSDIRDRFALSAYLTWGMFWLLVAIVASREASLALPGAPGPVDHAIVGLVDQVTLAENSR